MREDIPMPRLPKDSSARVIGAEARKLVHYRFASERWEFHEITGQDCGLDCTVELVENEQFINKRIDGQIKGTQNPCHLKNEEAFSFSLHIKTINYGLSNANAFVLFFVTVDDGTVYYLPIQDYFIANPVLFDKLENNFQTINVHIPYDNIVCEKDFDLQQLAKSVYINGPSKDLQKISANRKS